MNTDPRWASVDDYFVDTLFGPQPLFGEVLAANRAAGLPPIDVSPLQAQFLALLTTAAGVRTVLEIGTLGGYSTCWFANAVGPAGRVTTLEIDPEHARIARDNLARAGFADRVEVRVGAANDSLAQLIKENVGPFDLVFIDADKPRNAEYFTLALQLSRPGTILIVDNVVRSGDVADAQSTDASVRGARAVTELIARDPRVRATAMQTVGVKGYDGFIMAIRA